jgi:membrane associated rhomboid family serine protease
MILSITTVIVALTVITSLLAFNRIQLFENLMFWPYRIWRNNEWYRLVSCGFIHADIAHLFFNMFSLFSFGLYIENTFENLLGSNGRFAFLAMYIGAIASADAFNLFRQKDNFSYRSIGASGGVAAVIFSYILLNPYGGISIFFLPYVPAFIFGGLYLTYSAYMAKRGGDNIGHMAHFTGSVFGFFFPCFFQPTLLKSFFIQLFNP